MFVRINQSATAEQIAAIRSRATEAGLAVYDEASERGLTLALLGPKGFPLQSPLMDGFPGRGNFGKYLIVGMTDDFPLSEPVVIAPTATGGKVAHVLVEHCDGGRRIQDEQIEQVGASPPPGLGPAQPDLVAPQQRKQQPGGDRHEHPALVNAEARQISGIGEHLIQEMI